MSLQLQQAIWRGWNAPRSRRDFLYACPSPEVYRGLLTQEIYKKSSKKIYKKWTSSKFDFAAIRFSAEFYIFDFSSDLLSLASRTVTVGSCEAITFDWLISAHRLFLCYADMHKENPYVGMGIIAL